jgi:hypothetical protein
MRRLFIAAYILAAIVIAIREPDIFTLIFAAGTLAGVLPVLYKDLTEV